jgi:hypothetical protein
MRHDEGSLSWQDCTREQARHVLMCNSINGQMMREAVGRFNDPAWTYGPHIAVIDTFTDKAARIDNLGAETYDVHMSELTGEALLNYLTEYAKDNGHGPDLDHLIIID